MTALTVKLDKLAALLSPVGQRAIRDEALFADLLGVPTGERYPPCPTTRDKSASGSFRRSSYQLEDLAQAPASALPVRRRALDRFDFARSAGSDRRALSYGCPSSWS